MYFILYRTTDDSDGIDSSIKTVWGDCDSCHDYGVKVDFAKDEHCAYAFAVNITLITVCDLIDSQKIDGENNKYIKFAEKFIQILNSSSIDELLKISKDSLKEYFIQINELWLPIDIGVTIGLVEESINLNKEK